MIKQPPFELRLLGDEATARLFVGRAKQIFYNLINGLDPDVKTITRDYELDPRGGIKGVIRVYKSFDINIVTIHAEAPELEKIPEPYRKIWEPWNGTNENICTDHLWEFNMRTGQSAPVAFHSTVNDFYGAAPDPVSGYPGIPALTNP